MKIPVASTEEDDDDDGDTEVLCKMYGIYYNSKLQRNVYDTDRCDYFGWQLPTRVAYTFRAIYDRRE